LNCKQSAERFVPAAMAAVMVLLIFLPPLAQAAQQSISTPEAPAGQMCPNGSYVIGFDSSSNIICSGECGNGVLNAGETCDDRNTASGDGCSAVCQSEPVETINEVEEPAEEIPVSQTSALAVATGSVITDITPRWIVSGTPEVTITVTGTGFVETSVVIFEGKSHETAVNSAGTQLSFKAATADLSIGSYAVTVSNGPGLEVTRKKALVVY
jgi:cysteine-rich repeat protein